MKEKKLLIVCPWGPYGEAGIEKAVSVVANKLVADSYEVQILALTLGKAGRNIPLDSRIGFVEMESRVVKRNIWKLAKIIKDFRPDVILANMPSICTAVLITNSISGVRAKVISVNQGMDFYNFVTSLHVRLNQWLSDKVVVVSQGIKDHLRGNLHLDVGGVSVIYNGIDIEKIERMSQESVKKSSEKKIIVSVGRLHFQKNFPVLLRAISHLVQNGQDIELWLIGDGPERNRLEGLVKTLGIGENVKFLGWQDNPYKFIKNADVFALSSDFEGFPNVLLEALACGTSVVSTDCPTGPREILDDEKYGKLVPVGDDKVMALAIKKSLQNPTDPNLLISRAKYFSEDEMISRYEREISKIV